MCAIPPYCSSRLCVVVFFFNDTATTEIYTLSLHDALPILVAQPLRRQRTVAKNVLRSSTKRRSEEHTSELQSQFHLVCRLLLEKKKQINRMQVMNIFYCLIRFPCTDNKAP